MFVPTTLRALWTVAVSVLSLPEWKESFLLCQRFRIYSSIRSFSGHLICLLLYNTLSIASTISGHILVAVILGVWLKALDWPLVFRQLFGIDTSYGHLVGPNVWLFLGQYSQNLVIHRISDKMDFYCEPVFGIVWVKYVVLKLTFNGRYLNESLCGNILWSHV